MIKKVRESERERDGQSGRKGDRKYLVCLKEGMGGCEINRKTDKQRQTTKLVHSDTLRIRTIRDCNATHLLLCLSSSIC